MKSVMKHKFSEVPRVDIPRSTFNRAHAHKTTFNSGRLVPFFCDEVLPGDTFNLNATIFARMATPIAPIMDNLFLDTQYFFVPYRLIWDNWKQFMGEQTDPGDSTDYLIPVMEDPQDNEIEAESLLNYLGLPIGPLPPDCSSLPARAYYLIWNEWYRDQNLQDSIPVPTGDGPDDIDDWVSWEHDKFLMKRGKRHDYFTSCLPWPQKGPGVELPLGTTAPVLSTGQFTLVDEQSTSAALQRGLIDDQTVGIVSTGTLGSDLEYSSGLEVDLQSASPASINSLREAFQLQKMLERDARGGTRYIEMIKSHFGVTSPDARIQRPEYLGGRSTPINISPVQQTSSTDATSPQGNLAAYGTVSHTRDGFNKSFTEHGIVMGILSVRADLSYQQGVNRMWSRSTRYDFYFPALAHLGEQEVLNKEIYFENNAAENDDVFGYQERWAEYRYKPSIITGNLSSLSGAPIDLWHLAQEFESLPTLSDSFIREAPPMSRVLAVPSESEFIMDSYLELKCTRPMPVYSVPGMIDHF